MSENNKAAVPGTENTWLKFTEKFSADQLTEFVSVLRDVGIVTIDDPVDHVQVATHLDENKIEHVDVVLALASASPEIIEILMGEPITRGPASRGKDQSAPHTRPNGSKSAGGKRVAKNELGEPIAAPAADDPRIVATVKPNPKKASSKSFVRYAIYYPGISVKEFIVAGGLKADVKYDVEHGFITLQSPEEWAAANPPAEAEQTA